MLKLIKNKNKKEISLKNHYERRNKILIKRRVGGYGDILMTRMIFQDLSQTFPEAEITFACPSIYLEMAKNHPYVKTVELGSVNEKEYGIVYDLSTICRIQENQKGHNNKNHRSDIWAQHCGITLKNHNMFLTTDPEMLELCKKALKQYNKENKPSVLLTSTSNTNEDEFGKNKSLTTEQINDLVKSLQELGFYVFTVHNEKQTVYDNLGIDQIINVHQKAWIALVELADAVISVDTATFHIAGGLKKPQVGIFTFTKGENYSKYYENCEIIQGTCPFQSEGCYNFFNCPKSKNQMIPCKKNITASQILDAFSKIYKLTRHS